MDTFVGHFNYVIVVMLLMIGLWGMLAKRNLVKKCISMAIFQTAIILFYISMGAKTGATIPIIEYGHHAGEHAINASHYANPLTQILMLTAIVVGVATLGLALALVQKIYKEYGTANEDAIIEALKGKNV